MRENMNLYPSVFPRGLIHPLCPWESICAWVSELVYYSFLYVFCKSESWFLNTVGRWETWGVLLQNEQQAWKFFNPVHGSWPWNTGILVGQKFFQNFLLMNIFANPILFSDPVFWLNLKNHVYPNPINPGQVLSGHIPASSPGVLLWSLWVLQEPGEFISSGASDKTQRHSPLWSWTRKSLFHVFVKCHQ